MTTPYVIETRETLRRLHWIEAESESAARQAVIDDDFDGTDLIGSTFEVISVNPHDAHDHTPHAPCYHDDAHCATCGKPLDRP